MLTVVIVIVVVVFAPLSPPGTLPSFILRMPGLDYTMTAILHVAPGGVYQPLNPLPSSLTTDELFESVKLPESTSEWWGDGFQSETIDLQQDDVAFLPSARTVNPIKKRSRGPAYTYTVVPRWNTPSGKIARKRANAKARKIAALKPFKKLCPVLRCGLIYDDLPSLLVHLRLDHATDKKAIWYRKRYINKEAKPFICPEPDCKSGAARKYDMARHLRSKHGYSVAASDSYRSI
jgi:hypothetical protein